MSVGDLQPGALVLVVVAALLIGIAKTSVGGLAMVSVGILAGVLPSWQSAGFALLLFLVGDVYAVTAYRRHADVALLKRLSRPVLGGVVVGAAFVFWAQALSFKALLGWLLIALTMGQSWLRVRRRRPPSTSAPSSHWTTFMGGAAGFGSMVANAGGPVMGIYLIRVNPAVFRFLGTGAWFFLGVNLMKLPFSIGLGLVSWSALVGAVVMAPVVLSGAVVGRQIAHRITPNVLELLVLIATGAAGIALIV